MKGQPDDSGLIVGSPAWLALREAIHDARLAIDRVERIARREDVRNMDTRIRSMRNELDFATRRAFGGREVYVIRRPDTNEVKIGISRNADARLASLQTAHGTRLEMVVRFPGSEHDEAELHARFSDARRHGEWFTETPAVAEWIAEVQEGRHA